MNKVLRNKKGVTLVELLAVIVILGIIAAIAVPTIGGLIDNQRENAAVSEWTNIEEAARLYIVDNSVTAGTYFSIDDLVNGGYLSAAPDATLDAAGVTSITADDIFTAGTNGAVSVVNPFTVNALLTNITVIYVDGFLVHTV